MKAHVKIEIYIYIYTKLGDTEIQNQRFHQPKGPISILSFGKKVFKYLISYKDPKIISPLCIFLPKMSAYRKDFDETKYTSF